MSRPQGSRQFNDTFVLAGVVAISAALLTQMPAHARGDDGGIPCGYEITQVIQAPPCSFGGPPITVGLGISPNGRYVCGYYSYSCVFVAYRAFVYDTWNETFTTLPHPPGVSESGAAEVTNDGLVVGGQSGNDYYGFIYDVTIGEYVTIIEPAVPNGMCSIRAINQSNQVCGSRAITGPPGYTHSAFVWSKEDGIIDLGLVNGIATEGYDLNDIGYATGDMYIGGVRTAFLWRNRELIQLPSLAGLDTRPFALNNLNQVVGWSHIPNPNGSGVVNRAFIADLNGTVNLGVLPGFERSFASDINDDSIVVGDVRPPAPLLDHAFVWADGVMHDLNDLVMDSMGILLEGATAIGPTGTIVAVGTASNGEFLTVVLKPLPSAQADIVVNCRVDVDDLLVVINEWGEQKSIADINIDGTVNVLDLAIVIKEWTFD